MSATRTVTVDVTAEDIAAGAKGYCGHCPVALAITRRVRQRCLVFVGQEWIVFVGNRSHGDYAETPMPRDARVFTHAFDHDMPVVPFTFTLDLPTEVLR